MQTIKFGILSLALLAGCDLFSSSSSNGSNGLTPPVYQPGTPGSVVNRDADVDATPVDGNAPVVDANVTAPDGAKPEVDASIPDAPVETVTYPTKTWTAFGRIFETCNWFGPSSGLCATKPAIGAAATLAFDLYKTGDGGKTWTLVSTVDTGNANPAASVDVYMPTATDLWFVTGAAGTTVSGTIGNSPNGGLTWFSKANNVFSVLSGPVATPVPLRQIRSGSSALWLLADGANLLRSKDGGDTWTLVSPPADFGVATTRSLFTVSSKLYLSYLNAGSAMGMYTASDFGDFTPVMGAVPTGSMGSNATTWLHSSANVPGVFMCDRSPLPNWGVPFWMYALLGGTTPTKIMSATTAAETKLVGLRDGIVVERAGVATVYISGVFSEAGGNYLQIRKSSDSGASWSVLHSEPAATLVYASLMVDSMGNVHAMRLTSDLTGNQSAYDAHTVVE